MASKVYGFKTEAGRRKRERRYARGKAHTSYFQLCDRV
jgi:hypothetical protein